MKKYFFLLSITIEVFFSNAQNVIKSMNRLPDTGVNTSYTPTFGEDNDFQIYPPFFIDNGDGTITDTITGLMWQKTDGGEMTIEAALLYCDSLTLGGYTNWRLPNAHESFSILNHQNANPALDETVFVNNGADYWWTSSRQANDSDKVWVTNAGGGIGNHPKTETISAGGTKKFTIRAVRDLNPTQQISNHFTINGDGTINDNLTGLIWQQFPLSDSLNWEQALAYADTLTISGNSNWRLPNIKELQSINDESRINPSINNTVFSSPSPNKYWSSTTLPNQTTKAWFLDTHFGITSYDVKTLKNHLICVSGDGSITLSLNENKYQPFTVYPNPFKSFVHIKTLSGNEQFELSNTIGQIIYSGKNIDQFSFFDLPSGTYFLKIIGDSTSILKLIRE